MSLKTIQSDQTPRSNLSKKEIMAATCLLLFGQFAHESGQALASAETNGKTDPKTDVKTMVKEYGPQPALELQKHILTLREKAWRTWFSNDVEGFLSVVPDELVGIAWDENGAAWNDRKEAILGMQKFADTKQHIHSLSFPHNVFQQYGDVVILYSRYEINLIGAGDSQKQVRGRCTEIFVKREGRWIHTGWHLDDIAQPTS